MLFCYCHDCTSNMSFFITVERVKFAQTIVNRVKIAFINSSASWVDDIYEFVTIGSENWLYATDICKSDSSDKNETFPFSLSICRVSFCCSTVEFRVSLIALFAYEFSSWFKESSFLVCRLHWKEVAFSQTSEEIDVENSVLPPASTFVMSLKERSFLVSPGTVLSILCLLLCSVGFIRIETIFKDYEQRLKTVEKVMPHDQMKRARTNLASTNEGNWKHSVLYNISFHINLQVFINKFSQGSLSAILVGRHVRSKSLSTASTNYL